MRDVMNVDHLLCPVDRIKNPPVSDGILTEGRKAAFTGSCRRLSILEASHLVFSNKRWAIGCSTLRRSSTTAGRKASRYQAIGYQRRPSFSATSSPEIRSLLSRDSFNLA